MVRLINHNVHNLNQRVSLRTEVCETEGPESHIHETQILVSKHSLSVLQFLTCNRRLRAAVCCDMLQYVPVSCNVLQSVLHCCVVCYSVLAVYRSVRCSVLHCALQFVGSVLQCFGASEFPTCL